MLGKSGVGVHLAALLERLVARGEFAFHLVGDPERLAPFLGPRARPVPCRIPVYSTRELLLPLAAPPADVFWSPHFNTPLLPVRARRRVVTVHDCFHLDHLGALSPARQAYARATFALLPRLADRLVTVSRFSRARLSHHTGVPRESIAIVPNAIDPARFHPADGASAARARLAAGPHRLDRPYLLFVGMLKPHKNVGRLIEAFAACAHRLPDHLLALAGPSAELLSRDESLPGLIRRLGIAARVRTLGAVAPADLPDLYRGAAAFAFPSLYEGFGIPPLEAMACGTPCLLSPIPPVREVCGDAGLYADPLDPRAMGDALLRLVFDDGLRRTLTASGLARAGRFSWDRSADTMTALLAEGDCQFFRSEPINS